jgi:hypothetical protein
LSNVVRFPAKTQDRWERAEVMARLTPEDVQTIMRACGVGRLRSGGPGDWKAFVPWRENVNDEAMTIRRKDGTWSDKGTGDGGAIFDAVERAGLAGPYPASLEWLVAHLGWTKAANPTPTAGRTLLQEIDYDYRDESGALLYRARRVEYVTADGEIKKDFLQGRPIAGDQWEWKLPQDGVRRVLFQTERLATHKGTIYYVEGEKCALALGALGLLAVTNVGGSQSWRDEYAGQLAGRDVVVLPDNDDPGWKFGQQVAGALLDRAASVKLLELPGLGPRTTKRGLDIADWLAQGGTTEELVTLAATAPLYAPDAPRPLLLDIYSDLLATDLTPPRMLVTDLWEASTFGVIAAAQKSFKSFFVLDLLLSIATGADCLGHPGFVVPERQRVVLWLEEGNRWELQRRVQRWCEARRVDPRELAGWMRFIHGQRLRVGDDTAMDALRAAIDEYQPALVVCDTLAAASVGLDENKQQDMNIIVDGLKALTDLFQIATIYVHHFNKLGQHGFAAWRGSGVLAAAAESWVTIERKNLQTNDIYLEPGSRSGLASAAFRCELVDAPLRTGPELSAGVLEYRGAAHGASSASSASGDLDSLLLALERWGGFGAHSQLRKALNLETKKARYDGLVAEALDMGLVLEHTRPAGPKGGQPLRGLVLPKGALDE